MNKQKATKKQLFVFISAMIIAAIKYIFTELYF